jgi:hypothetical protein
MFRGFLLLEIEKASDNLILQSVWHPSARILLILCFTSSHEKILHFKGTRLFPMQLEVENKCPWMSKAK